jgi:hypothetical protein
MQANGLNINNLDEWISPTTETPLKDAFLQALTKDEKINLANEITDNVEIDINPIFLWKKTLATGICNEFDIKTSSKFLLIDKDITNNTSSKMMYIEILNVACIPSKDSMVGFSYSSDKSSQGPIIPIRYCYIDAGDKKHKELISYINKYKNNDIYNLGIKDCSHLPYGVVHYSSSLKELLACRNDFEFASKQIDSKCKLKFNNSDESKDGLFKLSFLFVRTPIENEIIKKVICSNIGCFEYEKYNCSKCKTPYCSKACQSFDWKKGHKLSCSNRTLKKQNEDEIEWKNGYLDINKLDINNNNNNNIDNNIDNNKIIDSKPVRRFILINPDLKLESMKEYEDDDLQNSLIYIDGNIEISIKIQFIRRKNCFSVHDKKTNFLIFIDLNSSNGNEINKQYNNNKSQTGKESFYLKAHIESNNYLKIYLDSVSVYENW